MKFVPLLLICFILSAFGALSAQTKQSDREFAGLKGKVKSALTERAGASMKGGRVVESRRQKYESLTFQQDGSALTNDGYDWQSGELFESTRYFLIDGDKVQKSTDGPGAITITTNPPADKPVKPSDPRYDFKLKYKYDDKGRITEEAWWQNDGDLWLRYVYEYGEGERRDLVFDKNGALNQKYTYKLDGKGNETEMAAFDVKTGEIESKEQYEYQRFDAEGNWTKRTEYEANSETGFKFKVRGVKYRILTYYP